MPKYYDIDDGTCLLSAADDVYLLLTRRGKWQDGWEIALDHLFRGESGAEQIDEATAKVLAGNLCGKWPPALD